MKVFASRQLARIAMASCALLGCGAGTSHNTNDQPILTGDDATGGGAGSAATGGRAGGGGEAGTSFAGGGGSVGHADAGSSGSGGAAGALSTGGGGGGSLGSLDAGAPADDAGGVDPGEPPADGNAYIAVGYSSRRILSTDGVNWGNAATFNGPFENVLEGVAIGDGTVVAVGQAGIFRSTDGKTWDQINSTFMTSVMYHDGAFLAFVDDSVYRSTDAGKTWSRKTNTGSAIHWRTAYGNGHYVAIGDQNASIGCRKVSEDGLTWHDFSDKVGFRLNSVAYGNGHFVAVGQGGAGITSTDGKTWENTQNTELGDFPVIAFGDGKFIVCAGACRASTDGKTWGTLMGGPAPSTQTYGKGQWVGMGDAYMTSTDGLHWTQHGGGASGIDHVTFGRLSGIQ